MKRSRYTLFSLALACVALLALLGLAVLQYRWVGQVSDSARERMQTAATVSAARFSEEFDRELARAYLALQMDALTLRDRSWTAYSQRYNNWRDHAPYPQLVDAVYLATIARNGRLTLARFDAHGSLFEPVTTWPTEFVGLRDQLAEAYRTRSVEGELIVVNSPDPVADNIPALVIPVARPWLLTSTTEESDLIDADFVIGRSIFTRSRQHCQNCQANSPLFAYTIVTLKQSYLYDTFVPMLVRRHLGGDDMSSYYVEIVSHSLGDRVIYPRANETTSASRQPDSTHTIGAADATAEMFTLRMDEFNRLVFDAQDQTMPDEAGQRPFRIAIGMMQTTEATSNPNAHATSGWQLRLRHQDGSLETVVESLRLRNLAISFGILLLLGFAIAMIVVSSRRAQRLARQQVDFVAAVSHELRTPLSVICSAGENLADGVIHDQERARQYGALIHREGRRLADMVEQVLDFAGSQTQHQASRRMPIDPAHLVERALMEYQPHIEHANAELVYTADADLPLILGDDALLRRALHNLISNAIKYGHAGGRIVVAVTTDSRRAAVQIAVSDQGPGIEPVDLPHIFEPFYRGAEALASQLHGSGLGLSLVKAAVDAHRGSISVHSVPGQGSTFTMLLPASLQPLGQDDPPIVLVNAR